MTALEQAREALEAARDCILIDRTALADCHMDPVTNEVDADGRDGVADYDAVLALIGGALAALSAQEVPQEVPAGEWVMVPREPTQEMLRAAIEKGCGRLAAVMVYHAMLTAAPAAPKQDWQLIETAPKDGSEFLCWIWAVRYGETDEGQQYQQDVSQASFCNWRTQADIPDCGWFDPCCGQIADRQTVTHWMPLPSAPASPQD